jgi:1-acyl-sn-glycerol-3-phosphate acyltransferase
MGARMILRPVPALGPAVPARGGRAQRFLGRAILGVLGWRVEGEIPNLPRCVLIIAPHTSNWDFVIGLAALLALDLRVTWLGKHQIFRWPFGALWRSLGGVPVDRSSPDGVVEHAAAVLGPGRSAFLGMAPEGTRRKVERWKSGFWRIARAAAVPILPVAFDFRTRAVVFAAPFTPTADYAADLAALQARFSPDMARNPANY